MPAPSGEPVISIRGLVVERGRRAVLPGISLFIQSGRVTGLLGPSGSGKTTLLRAIVGVQAIKGGEVTVLGEPAGSPGLRHRVAYVTQAPSVYPDLTVTANLRYFARILDAPGNHVRKSIATVDLDGQAEQLAGTLSGGERSRASLAVSLLGSPELLVLDEPTVGLDPVLRRQLWNTFHALADSGASLLVSTHVMDEADRCDDLILLRDGRVVATDTPDGIRGRTGKTNLEDAFLALAEIQ